MKDETPAWLSYADENLDVAELSLANNHLNPRNNPGEAPHYLSL